MSKPTQEPKIDGRPICEIIQTGKNGYEYIDKASVAYMDRCKPWTAYIGYDPYDPGDPENGPRIEFRSIEEIDVWAQDEAEARIITELAMMWHYEPGGTIIVIQPPEWQIFILSMQ